MSKQRLGIILAAGKGTRMNSDLPKVLCEVGGRPMVEYVIDALEACGFDRIVLVVGYKSELVRERFADRPHLEYAEQTEQKGTGHAVMVCESLIRDHQGPVLIVTGDSPSIQVDSLRTLMEEFEGQGDVACLLGTLIKGDPHGLGRIVRDEGGDFQGIVEEKDATPEQRQITEVNMSTYVFDCQSLLRSLGELNNSNAQGEYYITDCPGILKAAGQRVMALATLKPCEALSVNTVEQLAIVEAEMRKLGLIDA